jgi:hypothetical protein
MDLTERQKRNLLLLLCVFFGSMGLIANDLLSGNRVDRAWILFAVGCLGGSIEVLVRARTNHPLVWPPGIYQRAAITVFLIGFLEVVVSLVMRATLDVAPETAKVVVFGGAVAIAVPTLIIIVVQGRREAGESGP